MSTGAAWFIDGAYVFKVWQGLKSGARLDYLELRRYLETTFGERIDDAYYFNADTDPPNAKANAFHSALSYPPPNGPGIRVKLYWLQKRPLFWPASWGGGPVLHPVTSQHYELMRSFGHRKWKRLFLAAGDSDFHEAVQHLVENEDVELILIGTTSTISGELLPYARAVVNLHDIAEQVTRV
jgi:hypothetical protein